MSATFAKARDLLRELQDLFALGRHEDKDADSVRAQLEDLNPNLDPHEQLLLKGLSADLYMLNGEELPDPQFEKKSKDEILRALRTVYFERRDPERALELLRGEAGLGPEVVAFMRAQCWDSLGEPEIALWFMTHAEATAPQPNRYGALSLQLLLRLGRDEEALAKAQGYLGGDTTDVQVALTAIHVVFDKYVAVSRDASAAKALRETIVGVLERYRKAPFASRNPHWGLIGAHHAAACQRLSSSGTSLRESYDFLLERFSDLDVVWAARGMDLRETEPREAEVSLLKAIDLDTVLMWPYRHLALTSYEKRLFPLVLKYARKAFETARHSSFQAEMLALMALAQDASGAPDEDVFSLFSLARMLDPTNAGIEKAYNETQSHRRHGISKGQAHLSLLPSDAWQTPPVTSLDAAQI